LKSAGCTHILATTAVGSLREEIGRGDFVILDQFIDFTKHRQNTFHEAFEPHKPIHTPMAEPFSKELRAALVRSCEELGLKHHKKGTVITIEGPRFSTKAESKMFCSWGADVINMSIAPEAALAGEAGIPYAAVAMSTDYDCWKEDEEPVTWEAVLAIFSKNVEKVTKLLITALPKITDENTNGKISEQSEKKERQAEQPHQHAEQQQSAEQQQLTEQQQSHQNADQQHHHTQQYEIIKSKIRTVPHFPKQGIMFRDITTLLKDSEGFNSLIDMLVERYSGKRIDVVAGIESRGFITGAALAHRLGVGFVPIRKAGKLPGKTISVEYTLEYGTGKLEVHTDAIPSASEVLVVDDLLATGGTALAACELVKKLGANVIECSFIVDLPDLGGKKKLESAGYKVFNLVEFEGD
jgi:5'-methylthioadenosine phosphorylase